MPKVVPHGVKGGGGEVAADKWLKVLDKNAMSQSLSEINTSVFFW